MRPIEHLPVPFPKNYDPGTEYFYNNFVQHFIPDMIKLMDVGLHIDYEAVESLRSTIYDVLSSVDARLLRNKLVNDYQKIRLAELQKSHYKKHTENTRNPEDFYKEYDNSVLHRTFVVNTYLDSIDSSKDKKEKWTVKDLKTYNIFKCDNFLSSLIDKSYSKNSKHILNGMNKLAEYKTELWNRPRYDKANSKAPLEPFNPGSNKQLNGLFNMLGIKPLGFSNKTGEASWGRDYVEELKNQIDKSKVELHEILDCIIDHSFSDIIKNNFLKAFDTFTIDEVLHGNIKLFGAKSFRNTSNSPNLLNMPSSKSIYAKPLKKCFKAPEGYLIYAIDFAALEDRVIANLSNDTNKQNIFLEGLDGHSLNACGYFVDEVAEIMGENTDNVKYVKDFFGLYNNGNKEIEAIRFKSKAPTFKLAYGGYPDSDKGGVITQEIFDNYHNLLYPGISEYREKYVLTTCREQGYIHLGLGCRIYTDNADNDIRTLHNATVQFWSILTLIAVNELNYLIARDNLEEDIAVCSTIYDSIYLYVKKDAECIKWLNDNAVRIMKTEYLENQVVPNDATGEIGPNWADLTKVPQNSSIEEIEKILNKI